MTFKPSRLLNGEIGIRVGLLLCVLLLTGLRLGVRGRSRWGWDDVLACFGCVWRAIHALTSLEVFLRFGKEDSAQVVLFAVSFSFFALMLWSARLSILATIIRITPEPIDKKRRWIVLVGFLVLCFVELGQICWACATNTSWIPNRTPKCFNYKRIILIHLISSILSDSLLLFFPLSTLRTLRPAARRIRIRLSLSFVASACTTILSVVASLLVLIAQDQVHGYISLLEGCTSLIVCNLPVLVDAVCHILGVSDFSRPEKSLPPIEFAPPPGSSIAGSIIPISDFDTSQTSRPSRQSFSIAVKSFATHPQGYKEEGDADIQACQVCKFEPEVA